MSDENLKPGDPRRCNAHAGIDRFPFGGGSGCGLPRGHLGPHKEGRAWEWADEDERGVTGWVSAEQEETNDGR